MRKAPLLCLSLGVLGCESPSSGVDPTDLRGVLDPRASSSATAGRPAASASAVAPVAPTVRPPSDTACVADAGTPAEVGRVAGRPACRSGEVLEWRDPSGAPRYACLYTPTESARRGKIPLLVFFHGTGPGLDDPTSAAKLTSLRDKMSSTDLTGEGRPGFSILAVQGRALQGRGSVTFDVDHASEENLDKLTVDRFIDVVSERGLVDARRVYAVGMGRGGQMAITYTMLRADRVAAFAAFAPLPPSAAWACPGPPPPGLVLYRACDAVAPCEKVEEWLLARDAQRARTTKVRLGEGGKEEPACAVRNKCTPKRAEAQHHRWPKDREKDVLGFLASHVLSGG